jgi:hypothetical protein
VPAGLRSGAGSFFAGRAAGETLIMDVSAGAGLAASHKSWWGPRIWRILHCLAEISDRMDCGPGWRIVLTETAQMLPCEMCRTHFLAASRALHLPVVGRSPREGLRHMLWATHAGTGGGLPESALGEVYSYGGDRGAVVGEVRRLVAEVAGRFRAEGVLDRFRVGHLEAWVRAVGVLSGLLAIPGAPSGTRGSGRRTGTVPLRGR